jgi:hypothetical protein
MSHRLQVLIPPWMDARIRRAAERARVSKGEWVRRAIERGLVDAEEAKDPVQELASLDGPTADVDQMLAEIEAGRR